MRSFVLLLSLVLGPSIQAVPPLWLPFVPHPEARRIFAGVAIANALREWAEEEWPRWKALGAPEVTSLIGICDTYPFLENHAWEGLFEAFPEHRVVEVVGALRRPTVVVVRGSQLSELYTFLRTMTVEAADILGRLAVAGDVKANRSSNVLVPGPLGRWVHGSSRQLYGVALDPAAAQRLESLPKSVPLQWRLTDPPPAGSIVRRHFQQPKNCRRLLVRNLI